jgi:hypothetical protein
MNMDHQILLENALAARHSPYTYSSLRALFAGCLATPHGLTPRDLMEQIFPQSEENFEFPNHMKSSANSERDFNQHFDLLTSLWNELLDDRLSGRGFRLSKLPEFIDDGEIFLEHMVDRHAEMSAFIEGLERGGYEIRPLDDSNRANPCDPDSLIANLDLAQILSLATFTMEVYFEEFEELVESRRRLIEAQRPTPDAGLGQQIDFLFNEIWDAAKLGEEGFHKKYLAFVEPSRCTRSDHILN